MAKKPENVKSFLEGLSKKLQPIWEKEKEELLELKKAEVMTILINFTVLQL